MRQRQMLYIAIATCLILTMGLAAFLPAKPAQAQGGAWSHTWTFDSGAEGWTIINGHGIVCCGGQFWGVEFGLRDLIATIQLPHGGYANYMALTYNVTNRVTFGKGILELHGQPEGYKFSLDDETVGNGGSSGGEKMISMSFPLTYVDSLDLYLRSAAGSDTTYITSVTISGTDCDPFGAACATPTPTFTPSPTLTPTPDATIPAPPSSGPITDGCTILGLGASTFTNLSKWRVESNGMVIQIENPPGTTGLPLTDAEAVLPVTLDPNSQYKITATYHSTTGVAGQFFIDLGKDQHQIDIAATTDRQTWTGPAQNYLANRDSSSYDLRIIKRLESPDPGLVMDFICIQYVATNAAGEPTENYGITPICHNCTYRPTGNLFVDIPQLFQWLWCNLNNLWYCVLRLLFIYLLQKLFNIIAFLALAKLWVSQTISDLVFWALRNLAILSYWINGYLQNLFTLIRAIVQNLLDAFGITDLINNIIAFFLTLPYRLEEFIAAILHFIGWIGTLFLQLQEAFYRVLAFLALVNYWIGVIVHTIESIVLLIIGLIGQISYYLIFLVQLLPLLINSVVTGFNTSYAIPVYAPVCTDQNSLLFAPCLGMYVLDNTVLLGPIYYLIPVTAGFAAWNTVWWAIAQLRGVLENS